MAPTDLRALLPLIVLGASIVIIMLVIAFYRNHLLTLTLTLIGLILAFITLPFAASASTSQVTLLLTIDHFAIFYIGLILVASIVVAVLAYSYLDIQGGNPEEFYILLIIATLGSATLAASSHFASFFLGLEMLSVSLYALIAYLRRGEMDIEAGIKYLILAATSAAILLFGMALIYAEMGTMEFSSLASLLARPGNWSPVVLLAGVGMVIVGIGFKLALVPFHMWTPDIYQGAPAPVTAFVATISKGSMFALLLRFFSHIDLHTYGSLFLVFTILAVASMLIGNLLALLENNIKRILAYSSIAHLGYLLVAFLASGALAVTAVTFYLVAYFVTTLGAFGIVTVLSGRARDADRLEDYRGLFWDHPWLTGIFTAMLLSLAGIPLTAGFVGKFYLAAAGVGSSLWFLVIILVVASAIGLFYYLRILITLFTRPEEGAHIPLAPAGPPLTGSLVLAVLTVLLFWLGVYPIGFIHLIQALTAGLV
jgi:NADH-quinone oxidoreductase subunit N